MMSKPEKPKSGSSPTPAIVRYLNRHAETDTDAAAWPAPRPDLRLVVVIPALAEKESLLAVLASLASGSKRLPQVEVMVVVNHRQGASAEIVANNRETLQLLAQGSWPFPVRVIDRASKGRAFLPKRAGVGAARRLGMDLALRRLTAGGRPERAAIACLDADSPVSPGYLDALLDRFDRRDAPIAGLCHYRHPLPADPERADAIVSYELWLRYLEIGLHVCRSPYAFQTVGSCMVCSCQGYALADGMPRRQAAEDFYFLQKLAKLGGPGAVAAIPGAMVHPSARVSDRVPFGTGKAMGQCQQEGVVEYCFAEPPQAFRELADFFQRAEAAYTNFDCWRKEISPALADFIEGRRGWPVLAKIRDNTGGARHFARAVHEWFDSLQAFRYARGRKRDLGGVWILAALSESMKDLEQYQDLQGLEDPGARDCDLEQKKFWLDRLRQWPGVIRKTLPASQHRG